MVRAKFILATFVMCTKFEGVECVYKVIFNLAPMSINASLPNRSLFLPLLRVVLIPIHLSGGFGTMGSICYWPGLETSPKAYAGCWPIKIFSTTGTTSSSSPTLL